MLYHKVRDQLDGKEDILTTLQYEWQYEDLYKDAHDMKTVNYRYGDHIDRNIEGLDNHSVQVFKPDADKAKQALRYYRHGNNSYLDWMKNMIGY